MSHPRVYMHGKVLSKPSLQARYTVHLCLIMILPGGAKGLGLKASCLSLCCALIMMHVNSVVSTHLPSLLMCYPPYGGDGAVHVASGCPFFLRTDRNHKKQLSCFSSFFFFIFFLLLQLH